MRRLCLILIAIALGAASPLGDADSDPESLITAIYQTYTDIAPGEEGVPNVEGVYASACKRCSTRTRRKRRKARLAGSTGTCSSTVKIGS